MYAFKISISTYRTNVLRKLSFWTNNWYKLILPTYIFFASLSRSGKFLSSHQLEILLISYLDISVVQNPKNYSLSMLMESNFLING
jgi:hypothetical protein